VPTSAQAIPGPDRDIRSGTAISLRPQIKTLVRRADKLAWLREQRDQDWPGGFALIAQSTVLAGLPLRPTPEKQITRTVRLGDGSSLYVTFGAMGKGAQMPYGADVTLLYFLLDRAISARSAIFEWKYAAEYLTFIGADANAGKNFGDLRARWRRILGLAVRIERTTPRGDELGIGMFLVEQYRLPPSIAPQQGSRAQLILPGIEYGLKLNETFWQDAIQHHVPVPKDLIRETRADLLLQRLAIFLGWRCYAAAFALRHGGTGESVVPWEDVRELLGSTDVVRNVRSKVREALGALRVLWPELQASPKPTGLWVAPPAGNAQLFRDGELRRKRV
jgi:hypothetical protein